MAQFRKKPVVIDAVRWRGYSSNLGVTVEPADMSVEITDDNLHNVKWERVPDWLPKPLLEVDGPVQPGDIRRFGEMLIIGTLEGNMSADVGDWIIRGVKGEVYPCKPDIFAATYEAV